MKTTYNLLMNNVITKRIITWLWRQIIYRDQFHSIVGDFTHITTTNHTIFDNKTNICCNSSHLKIKQNNHRNRRCLKTFLKHLKMKSHTNRSFRLRVMTTYNFGTTIFTWNILWMKLYLFLYWFWANLKENLESKCVCLVVQTPAKD